MEGTARIPGLGELTMTCICVDSYENGSMQGRVTNPASDRQEKFNNVVSLLKILNDIYDNGEYPQATMKCRSFASKKVEEEKSRPEPAAKPSKPVMNTLSQRGKLATYRLRIMFRQNASWQGTLTWVEKNKEESFRSALEMLMLIDSSFEAQAAAASGGNEESIAI